MLLEELRQKVVDYGNQLISSGLTVGTAGNISMFDPETGYMVISPSGIPYAKTTAEDVVVMDLKGNIIESDRKPSSENGLHAAFYLEKPEARAVVHAHSMYCTTLACAGIDLQATHYAIADAGVATLPTIPYATYGTPELAELVREELRESDSKAFLMANHGMVAYGDSLEKAFAMAMTAEWCAQVQWRAMAISVPNILTDEQMDEVIEHYKTYGQAKTDDKSSQGYFG
ncbi:MAG: class II aldolase/adducin family protein [Lachnospiraceae bacterium]|nr:class II aldolase/adducin family protein [Lachnospiraceae bacterium]